MLLQQTKRFASFCITAQEQLSVCVQDVQLLIGSSSHNQPMCRTSYPQKHVLGNLVFAGVTKVDYFHGSSSN
jgi:hypothetical protein